MKQKYVVTKSPRLISLVCLAALFTIAVSAHAAPVWNFSVPTQEVQPNNGVFTFPATAFQDGKAKYFEYKAAPDQRIRFFVVKSTDGIIRAAFDACEVCWRHKKGYVQQGNDMICVNCGLRFRTDKVNEVTGGCNPSALKRTVQDGNVIIALKDVMSGLRYFQ